MATVIDQQKNRAELNVILEQAKDASFPNSELFAGEDHSENDYDDLNDCFDVLVDKAACIKNLLVHCNERLDKIFEQLTQNIDHVEHMERKGNEMAGIVSNEPVRKKRRLY